MAINHRELGQRLRRARKSNKMTQEDLAGHLKVSRSTVAQMELGNRAVTGIELSRLAHLFGRSLDSFVEDANTTHESGLGALFQLHPDLASRKDSLESIRRHVSLSRELKALEQLLNIERPLDTAVHPLSPPETAWEAIRQGERIADGERRRRGLGLSALPDIPDMLETQSVRTAEINLPEHISGLTLMDPEIGVLVVANQCHDVLRKRFSFTHEYCHVLADRNQRSMVSRLRNRNDFSEIRANSFATSFLMPAAGVRQFINALGKGRTDRSYTEVYDGESSTRARARSTPQDRELQIYDAVQLAHHFGVSTAAACYRLRALRLIRRKDLALLMRQDQTGIGRICEQLFGIPDPCRQARNSAFRRRLLGLGLEALRRSHISPAHLRELVTLVDINGGKLDKAISAFGIGEHTRA